MFGFSFHGSRTDTQPGSSAVEPAVAGANHFLKMFPIFLAKNRPGDIATHKKFEGTPEQRYGVP